MRTIINEAEKSQALNGKLIFEFREGRLNLCLVSDTDEQTRRLLQAIHDRVLCGDLAELAR
jgi:hypothetical protein